MSEDKTNDTHAELNKAIVRALDELENFSAAEDGYAKITTQLDKLYKMKYYKPEVIFEESKKKPVSFDALVAVGGNLLGIVAILGFERAHVVSSKALGFVLKSRV